MGAGSHSGAGLSSWRLTVMGCDWSVGAGPGLSRPAVPVAAADTRTRLRSTGAWER